MELTFIDPSLLRDRLNKTLLTTDGINELLASETRADITRDDGAKYYFTAVALGYLGFPV